MKLDFYAYLQKNHCFVHLSIFLGYDHDCIIDSTTNLLLVIVGSDETTFHVRGDHRILWWQFVIRTKIQLVVRTLSRRIEVFLSVWSNWKLVVFHEYYAEESWLRLVTIYFSVVLFKTRFWTIVIGKTFYHVSYWLCEKFFIHPWLLLGSTLTKFFFFVQLLRPIFSSNVCKPHRWRAKITCPVPLIFM